jgi:serine/threonine protein phosphatase PrpC
MGFLTIARTHVGCRRKVNEDSALARPDLGVWAVADGMGGHHAGDVASALVVEALAGVPAQAPARLLEAQQRLEEANARLVAMGRAGPEARTIGSTVAALLADETGAVQVLWAGDSRIYRAREGALAQLTRDHSLVQDLVDLGEISPADAQRHPNANIITRAVGADERLNLDAVQDEGLPGDVFLLASDGLTRLIDDPELLAALQADDLDQAADGLLQTCLDRGAPDNVTFVIVRLQTDGSGAGGSGSD